MVVGGGGGGNEPMDHAYDHIHVQFCYLHRGRSVAGQDKSLSLGKGSTQ